MDSRSRLIVVSSLVCFFAVIAVACSDDSKNKDNATKAAGLLQGVIAGRALDYSALVPCGLAMDSQCFFETADKILENKRLELLAEADREALKVTGRAESGSTPSHLADTLSKLISEFTDYFKDTFSSFFKTESREGEEDDEVTETQVQQNQDASTARKKKKKGKLHALIKLIIIGIVLKVVITLLLKALSAALQVKFFLVALAGLILNAARFYFDLKKGHQPQKVIYYEHAQHQHHYEGGDEDWEHSSPGSSYWGRSYDEKDEAGGSTAQDLAYSKSKPYYSSGEEGQGSSEGSSYSW